VIRADEIHSRLGSSWPLILVQLGIPESILRNKHGPCPACGGKDRFRFDNRRGRGDFICNRCGSGDGFKLLQITHGWTFSMARKATMAAVGLKDGEEFDGPRFARPTGPICEPSRTPLVAQPTARIHRLRRDRCAVVNSDDAVDYLDSRSLWPLPQGCTLRAHSSVEYWSDGKQVGRYPALIADVLDIAGELVTCHVTWLYRGRKLTGHEPRKTLSSLVGRVGCAVRLMPAEDILGVAEGIETALSAARLDGIPVWAAINTSLLTRFEPPANVTTLRVYGDRDDAGLLAARTLVERLQGRIHLEIRLPPPPSNDWNDVLMKRDRRSSDEGHPNE
jgi:putative DNA primase/helicase